MARASLGPWIFVLDIGSSSHSGLIIAPGQEANGDNLGMLIHLIIPTEGFSLTVTVSVLI